MYYLRIMLPFSKYHGTGNDFILLDGFTFPIGPDVDRAAVARRWCHRHFGIGADGLIIVEPDENCDFRMDFYNPDGSQSFCGNGSRCAVKYFADVGNLSMQFLFSAIDGVHQAALFGDVVSIKMSDVAVPESVGDVTILDTGSPHFIRFQDQVDYLDMLSLGRAVRYSEPFAEAGINVNAVCRAGDAIAMRTYERGVEDETLSCGTGVTAAALAAHLKWQMPSGMAVKTRGGMLNVHFEEMDGFFRNIWLSGPAEFVFNGEIPW
jgi:diaminopimelate epimerase